MATGDIHTVPHRGGWANLCEGQPQVVNTARTRVEAEELGRELAILCGVAHIVHDEDGRISRVLEST